MFNNMKLVYTGCVWVGCYIWYSKEGTGRDRSPPRALIAVVTVHPSTAGVPMAITVLLLLYGPLFCGFSVPI